MAPYLWRFERGMEFGPEILIRLLPVPQPVYHDIQLVRGGENERGRRGRDVSA
jgi:hypothetical protein